MRRHPLGQTWEDLNAAASGEQQAPRPPRLPHTRPALPHPDSSQAALLGCSLLWPEWGRPSSEAGPPPGNKSYSARGSLRGGRHSPQAPAPRLAATLRRHPGVVSSRRRGSGGHRSRTEQGWLEGGKQSPQRLRPGSADMPRQGWEGTEKGPLNSLAAETLPALVVWYSGVSSALLFEPDFTFHTRESALAWWPSCGEPVRKRHLWGCLENHQTRQRYSKLVQLLARGLLELFPPAQLSPFCSPHGAGGRARGRHVLCLGQSCAAWSSLLPHLIPVCSSTRSCLSRFPPRGGARPPAVPKVITGKSC